MAAPTPSEGVVVSPTDESKSNEDAGKSDLVKNDLTLGILQLLQPAVDEVDDRVLNIR